MSRFEDFMSRLPISRAALSSRLAMMAEAGLLKRDPPDTKRADYVLTKAGEDLRPAYAAISEWSGQHLFGEGEKPRKW